MHVFVMENEKVLSLQFMDDKAVLDVREMHLKMPKFCTKATKIMRMNTVPGLRISRILYICLRICVEITAGFDRCLTLCTPDYETGQSESRSLAVGE